jgi:hypothetical protein
LADLSVEATVAKTGDLVTVGLYSLGYMTRNLLNACCGKQFYLKVNY